mmetsp:Transcript_6539/g.5870  ORF Transcript_6539/g.5870 Transcript_6539/m.5870 type:complete len:123 (-) Transcript_6539:148-516(-)
MKDNYFEFRMREDTFKLQKDDMLDILNLIVVPTEGRGVRYMELCRSCEKPFFGLNTLAYACGHMFHLKEECALSKDGTCPLCLSAVAATVAKFSQSIKKKKINEKDQISKIIKDNEARGDEE